MTPQDRLERAHDLWFQLVHTGGSGTGGSRQYPFIIDRVRRLAARHDTGAVVCIDGHVKWTDDPETFLRTAITTPLAFGAIPCADGDTS